MLKALTTAKNGKLKRKGECSRVRKIGHGILLQPKLTAVKLKRQFRITTVLPKAIS